MSYEILGSTGKYWSCHQCDWRGYLDVAIAFGWVPEGAFFKCDEAGYGEHPSGSYIGNDRQIVTGDDASAMAAALNRAVTTINAGLSLTDEQAAALAGLRVLGMDEEDLLLEYEWTEVQGTALRKIRNEYLAAHPDEVRTIYTRHRSFDLNIRGILDLAGVASAGWFKIA
jgi:hypothetical protein